MNHEEDAEAVVLVEDRAAQPILSVRGTVRIDQLGERQGESLRELSSALRNRGIAPVGPPFVRYHTFGETETDVEMGVPVADPGAGEGPVAPGELPGGPAITTWHLGSHDRLGEAYARLQAWLTEHDRTPAGAAWEVYHWIDPAAEPDPASWPPPEEWRAEIVQPLQSG
jgi:effector-binding domain-containing protein